MAATFFNNGDMVTPTFLNTIYSGGGHVHDGTDSDGHAAKIDLTRDTTSRLTASKIDSSTITFGMIWPTDYTCVFDATVFDNGFVMLNYGSATYGTMDSDTTHISATVLNPPWGLNPTSNRYYPIAAKNNQAMTLAMEDSEGVHYNLYSAEATQGISRGSIFFSIS
jgi:hypothetical protein